MRLSLRLLLAGCALIGLAGCPGLFGSGPDGGCTLAGLCPSPPPPGQCPLAAPADELAFWQTLAVTFSDCLLTNSTNTCRSQIEATEWTPLPSATTDEELHGVIAPGGLKFTSPERAPDGDFCVSHDDLDWNFNVAPDPGYSTLLRPANYLQDDDHPDAGVIESEWEAMYLAPAYVAKPPDAGNLYTGWPSPSVDMLQGDRVAERGVTAFDCGHSPYRAELHPPYLLMWGGPRDGGVQVHIRATTELTRPSDFRSLPQPVSSNETLVEQFALPAAWITDAGVTGVQVATAVDYFYDAPQLIVDQTCDLAAAINTTNLTDPSFSAAVASPAAHLRGTSVPALAPSFFGLTAQVVGDAVQVTLTPLQRPHQALFGATVTVTRLCGVDAGC